jgi:hypothetical protein
VKRDRHGEERTQTVHDREIYAQVSGYMLLQPTFRKIAPRVDTLKDKCEWLQQHYQREVNSLDDSERQTLSKKLSNAYTTLKDLYLHVEETREFLKPQNISTLRAWGARPNCPMRLHIERVGSNLYIGKTKETNLQIDAPLLLDEQLVDLPNMANVAIDD